MQLLFNGLNLIQEMGYTLSIPILLTLLCFCFRVGLERSVRTGVSAGFTIAGLIYIMNRFTILLEGLGSQIVGNGASGPITDAGWRVTSVISRGSPVFQWILPISLGVNLLMLLTRSTRTINLDWWSLWTSAFFGVLAAGITGKLYWGMLAAASACILSLVFADCIGEGLEEEGAAAGITTANAFMTSSGPVSALFCWLIDLIPGLKHLRLTFSGLQRRLGIFADPSFLGGILAALYSYISGSQPLASVKAGCQIGAMIYVAGLLLGLLSLTLEPLTDRMAELSEALNLRGRIMLGLNGTAAAASQTVLFLSVAMLPLVPALSRLLPGCRFLPLEDFGMLPYLLLASVLIAKGDLFRSVLSGILSLIVSLYAASFFSPLLTILAQQASPERYGQIAELSCLFGGGSFFTALYAAFAAFGPAGLGLLFLVCLAASIWNFNRLNGHVKIYAGRKTVYRMAAVERLKREKDEKAALSRSAVTKKRAAFQEAVLADRAAQEDDSN